MRLDTFPIPIAESEGVLAQLLELLAQPDIDWQAVLQCVLDELQAPAGVLVTSDQKTLARSVPGLPTDERPPHHLSLRAAGHTYGFLHYSGAGDPHPYLQSISAALGLALRSVSTEGQFTEFVSAASHDIRGGIGRANSFTQLLQQKLGNNADPELTELATLASTHLADTELLLRELSAYAHAGRKHSASSKSSIPDIFAGVVYLTRHRFDAAAATLVVQPLDVAVAAPEDTVTQVLVRILDNSLKFAGERPTVRITAGQTDTAIVIRVEDSGPPFDPAHLETIFAPFQRLHSKRYPGHGLGLAIARKTLTALGGTIHATPGDPSGLVIHVELPAA